MAPPTRRAAMKPWRSCIGDAPFLVFLEFLLESAVKRATGPELRREHAEARAVPDLVLLIPQVEDVEPRLHLADAREGEVLGDPEVRSLVGIDRRIVHMPDGAPEAAAGREIQAESRARPGPAIRGPGGGGDELVVVGVDVVILDECERLGGTEHPRRLPPTRRTTDRRR